MPALDIRVPFTACQAAFGLPGTVTRPAPDDAPIETHVVWIAPPIGDAPPGGEFQRRVAVRIMAISKADVPTVPRGTTIEAKEEISGASKTWMVDETDRIEHDHVRVRVKAVTES